MESLRTNILNLVSGEHKSIYDLADQVLTGIESDGKTLESKTAQLIFNAIIRFADSRYQIDRALTQLIGTATSERKRLRDGRNLDLGWINPSQFEAAVQESKKLWHEVHTLTYLTGLTADEVTQLANKIQSLTEYGN